MKKLLDGGCMGSIIELCKRYVYAKKNFIVSQLSWIEKNIVVKNVSTNIESFPFGIKDSKEFIYHLRQNLKKVFITLLKQSSKRDMVGKEIKLDIMDYTIGLKNNLENLKNVNFVEQLKQKDLIGQTKVGIINVNYQTGNACA